MSLALKHLRDPAANRLTRHLLLSAIVIALSAALIPVVSAQCVEHPEKNTTIKFNNETSFDLTFFIDEDEKGVAVASGTASIEFQVEAGEHLLRARAVVSDETFWVWTVNEVPAGQMCTWTVTDPQQRTGDRNVKFRTPIRAIRTSADKAMQ